MLSPTRELAIQIAEQFEALGADIGVRCAVLVGGIDMMAQAIALGKRPHIIVGTPGRVVDHLSNTKVGCAAGKAVMCHTVPLQADAFTWTSQAIAQGRGLHVTPRGGFSRMAFSTVQRSYIMAQTCMNMEDITKGLLEGSKRCQSCEQPLLSGGHMLKGLLIAPQGFSLKSLKHLVLDEADRLLNMDFEQEIDQILKVSSPSNPVRSCGNLVAIISAIVVVAACRGTCKALHCGNHSSGIGQSSIQELEGWQCAQVDQQQSLRLDRKACQASGHHACA